MLSAACATVATRPGAMRAAARTPKQSIAARATPAAAPTRALPVLSPDATPRAATRPTVHAAAASSTKSPATSTSAVASAPAAPAPFVLGYYLPGSGSLQSLDANYKDINAIAPLWFGIHANGAVEHNSGGSLATIVNAAHSLGRKVYVLVTNMGQDTILVNAGVRQTAVANLVSAVVSNHLDGVNIDFEGIDGNDAQGLVDFVSAVHAQLAPHGIATTVAVGPRASSSLPLGDESDAYSYAALGKVSDYVVLMTYDEHCPPGGPGAVAGLPWVKSVVNYAVTQIPASKILLGIAAYGYDWAQAGTPTVTASQAIAEIDAGNVQLGWSNTQAEPYYTSASHDVWFEDSYSAVPKFQLVRQLGLGGIALWYLGAEDSLFWPTVQADLLK